MRTRAWIAAAGACLAAIFATSCSRTTSPEFVMIRGDVRSASNAPVNGAVVEVRYTLVDPAATSAVRSRPAPADIPGGIPSPPPGRWFSVSNNPCELGSAVIRLSIPVDSRCTLRVLDLAGTVRRVLVDRTFVAGAHTLVWDGRDDADRPLPSNLYVVTWKDVQGDSVFEYSTKVLWHPEDPSQGANTATAANGSFSIPLDDLPIGESFEARDVADSLLGTRTIAWPITIVASGVVGGATLSGQVVVDQAHRKDRVHVVVQ